MLLCLLRTVFIPKYVNVIIRGAFLLSHWSSSSNSSLWWPLSGSAHQLPSSHSSYSCDELSLSASHSKGSPELAAHKRCCISSTDMHSVHQGSAIELQLILPRSQSRLTAAEQQDQWLSKQQCVGITADMTSWIASQAYTTALCSWHICSALHCDTTISAQHAFSD